MTEQGSFGLSTIIIYKDSPQCPNWADKVRKKYTVSHCCDVPCRSNTWMQILHVCAHPRIQQHLKRSKNATVLEFGSSIRMGEEFFRAEDSLHLSSGWGSPQPCSNKVCGSTSWSTTGHSLAWAWLVRTWIHGNAHKVTGLLHWGLLVPTPKFKKRLPRHHVFFNFVDFSNSAPTSS